jgi:lysyl-tRNA synthetase, class II
MTTASRWTALGAGAIVTQAGIGAGWAVDPARRHVIAEATWRGAPTLARAGTLVIAAWLLARTPGLWRGRRPVGTPVLAALLLLPTLEVVAGLPPVEIGIGLAAAVPVAVVAAGVPLAGIHRRAWRSAVLSIWGASCLALVLAGLSWVSRAGASGTRLDRLIGHVGVLGDLLIVCATVTSALTARALRGPREDRASTTSAEELQAARVIVGEHGEDSLAPFILRPDKTFAFAAGGVLAHRRIGGTAVVSGDPVGPDGAEVVVLGSFLARARADGLRVAVYGASGRHLAAYNRLGLRVICVGEEAVVDPGTFSLEGRAVRKLRQSVHRVQRRGWQVTARDGREIDADLEREIDALDARWRGPRTRMIGFAMGMGDHEPGIGAADLYLLGRSPEGELRAVMRFITHRGKLSLDTMRRVGDTPNGLNEALVCHALSTARERGIREVSLNYAGLAHLVRRGAAGNSAITRLALHGLSRRFQMERLVRFNEKFSPQWRPRYLVYESRASLPLAVFAVLAAEGYLPEPALRRRLSEFGRPRRALPGWAGVDGSGKLRVGQ